MRSYFQRGKIIPTFVGTAVEAKIAIAGFDLMMDFLITALRKRY